LWGWQHQAAQRHVEDPGALPGPQARACGAPAILCLHPALRCIPSPNGDQPFKPLEESLAWKKWKNILRQDQVVQQRIRVAKRKAR
jgi:hypothetical protein